MNSHELANRLLALPDKEVLIYTSDGLFKEEYFQVYRLKDDDDDEIIIDTME